VVQVLRLLPHGAAKNRGVSVGPSNAQGRRVTTGCAHCGAPLPNLSSETSGGADDGQARYCCTGCETVAHLLADRGLTRYYTLGGRTGVPASPPTSRRDHLWLTPLMEGMGRAGGHVTIDVQGLRCAACTWLLEETFRRSPGARRIVVDPGVGRIEIWAHEGFDLAAYVSELEGFGYVLGPPEKSPDTEGDTLLVRAGIASAIAMNVMTFAFAEYLGLTEDPLRATLRMASVVLAAAAVLIAAPPFLRGAVESLKKGVLSLDVPIALGIVLASSASLGSFLLHGEPRFADTVSVFVALMLIGRVIERRSLARARRQLLEAGDLPALFVRRVEGGAIRVVTASELLPGDVLVVAPGEVVPVDAILMAEPAELSLEWISGESQPESRQPGESVPAGAFLLGHAAARMTALTTFAASPILSLTRRPPPTSDEHGPRFWDRVARRWAFLVLLAASTTFFGWLLVGDLPGAIFATTAVLVVTCPCGIGIANPLAHELARATLRRAGLFVRTARALDRAAEVNAVVFDKTGTLTTGALMVATEVASSALLPGELDIAMALASTSTHPRADAVRRAYEGRHIARADVMAREVVGAGLEARVNEHVYRLGRPGFALEDHAERRDERDESELVFSRDGVGLTRFAFAEDLRTDAEAEVRALSARGLSVYVLSGDTTARARTLGTAIGIPSERCIGDARPEDKAAWLSQLAERGPCRALFVGDGLNDALAAEVAYLSGTPAIDRPFLPARTDFHFLSVTTEHGQSGLSAIRSFLETGAKLRGVTRRNLGFAFAYNVFAVVWAATGQMHPWLAAILMPLSSLVVIASTALSFPMRARKTAPVACPVPTQRSTPPSCPELLTPEPQWKS
jgi:Cu2+-exporting ATPase